MKKILNIVEITLLAIGVLAVVLWLVGVASVDLMLYVAYIYLAIAAVAAIGMTAANMGKSRNKNRIGLYVFGGLAVLGVIFYFTLASSQVVVGADNTVFDNVFTLKISDTMLYLAYAALGGCLVFLLGGEIRNAIK